MTGRTRSRGGLHVHDAEQTSVCDYCRRTFLAGELKWAAEDWVMPASGSSLSARERRRGCLTATRCPECDTLALIHCWRCAALTGREDDLCERCWRERVS